MMCETIGGNHKKLALPTPSRIPATGSTETGNIMHFPIFCTKEKALEKADIVLDKLGLDFGEKGTHLSARAAFEGLLCECPAIRIRKAAHLGFDGGNRG